MVYTITFNPALDYMVTVKDFAPGKTNRTEKETLLPGGKGINVSLVLHNLGIDSVTLGFTAGFTGEALKASLKEMGCETDFIPLKEGMTRINVKLQNVEGTEINARGPEIDKESLEKLFARLDTLQKGDILVLAGSIPASLPDTIYSDICKKMEKREVTMVVDATGKLLVNVLPYHPFLIKPNHHELGEIFGVEIHTKEEAASYAEKLRGMGAENVLVSMGGAGAVLAAKDGQIYMADAPKGEVVNAVGAGDSMVAGFLTGFLRTENYEEALKISIATGSASAFSDSLATREQMEAVRTLMK